MGYPMESWSDVVYMETTVRGAPSTPATGRNSRQTASATLTTDHPSDLAKLSESLRELRASALPKTCPGTS
ncbi:hypothetical protein GCM10010402_27070 [Actinomadura luteofluorescens]